MMEKLINKIKNNNIIKNSLIIFTGQGISSVIAFVNTFLLIKAIGVYGNGVLAAVQSYTAIFNGIFNFQSYSAVIKFGAEALEKNDENKFKQYLKQALIQDVITAIVAFIVGYLLIDIIGNFMAWDIQMKIFVRIYLITILFNITGSVTGMLRLKDEFKVIALSGVQITFVKCILLVIAGILNCSFEFYLGIEIVYNIILNLSLFYYGYKSLKKYNISDFYKVKINFDKEFTKFNFYNNIVSTFDMPTVQFTNLIINKMLGVSALGLYSIFNKFGTIINRVTGPIGQSLLPELSKIVAKDNKKYARNIVYKIVVYTNLIGAIAVIGVIVTQGIWLKYFMPANLQNIISLVFYLAYVVLTSSFISINLFFVSLNLVKYNLPIVIGLNTLYLISVYILVISMGINGIILALLLKEVVQAVIKWIIIKRNILVGNSIE